MAVKRNSPGALVRRTALTLAWTCIVCAAHAQQPNAPKAPTPEQVQKIQKLVDEGCKLWACTTDAGALAKMTDAERKLVQDTLSKVPAETSISELEKVLGPAHRGGGTPRPVWLGPDKDKKSQIAVYIKNNKIALIRWLKLRQWLWERAPSPAN
jgi:hypothetical protein